MKILIQVLDFFFSYRPQFPCWIGLSNAQLPTVGLDQKPACFSIHVFFHTQALLLQPHSQKIFKQFAFSQMCPKKASALACVPVKHVTEEEESHTDTGLFENFAPLETKACVET